MHARINEDIVRILAWKQAPPAWGQALPAWGQALPAWGQALPAWKQALPAWKQALLLLHLLQTAPAQAVP